MLNRILDNKLNEIKNRGLYRSLREVSFNTLSMPCAEMLIDGKKFVNFSSNNYLDLAFNDEVNEYVAEKLSVYGTGARSSRLISGSMDIHKLLELKLAAFKGKEAGLLYPSGYQANVGVISALCGPGDAIIMDKLCHASLWDGAKLSGARIFVYDHCDMADFEKVLNRTADYQLKIAITDSLFSMDGDFAPLDEFVNLCQKYEAVSIVDEAHATGVWGAKGAGACDMYGVADKVDVVTATLSKALGVQGGFVGGSKTVREYLVNKSRSFIYTTALSPMLAASALKSLEICQRDDFRREKLLNLSKYLSDKLQAAGLLAEGRQVSQIIPVITGNIVATDALAAELYAAGIYVPSIRPPTVEEGKCRLRISLTSMHTEQQVDALYNVITQGML
jgi:8-amino-7-oxononanoate synthase